jgi:hypothetical protein
MLLGGIFMKKNFIFTACLSVTGIALPASTAVAQYSNREECFQRADDQYYAQMYRCFNNNWGDSYERDLCQYSAGLEHDANVQNCYDSYPESSLLDPTAPLPAVVKPERVLSAV